MQQNPQMGMQNPQMGMPPMGMPGMPPMGMPGMPPMGMPGMGMPQMGMPGMNPMGMPQMGMPPMGMPGMPQMPGGVTLMNQGTPNSTLYVGNLPKLMEEVELFALFKLFGNVINVKIMRSTYTGESRCFGFVTFKTDKEAAEAQKELNNKIENGRELRVYVKKSRKQFDENANFIIRQLDKSIDSKQLTAECEKWGEIVSCNVK